MRYSYLVIFIFFFKTNIETSVALPEAKLTIKTLDENGNTLSNMPVHVWLSEKAIRDGRSDSNGIFIVQGPCVIRDVPITVSVQGYYDSRVTYEFPNYLSITNNKWQPWNPVVPVVARRIISPTPMYSKRVESIIPATNKVCGFDLTCGDWVNPCGKGSVSDLSFYVTQRITSPEDYEGTMILTFTNKFDGFQENQNLYKACTFPFPRFAPETGYQTNYIISHGRSPVRGYYGRLVTDDEKSHFFRIRSVVDEKGNLKEALYGNTLGEINISGVAAKQIRLKFTYYLNPTPNDRNLEFDPKRNLFKNLKSTEQVTMP